MKERLRVELKGYIVTVYGPDPFAALTFTVPVSDVLTARSVINTVNYWLEDLENKYNEVLKEEFKELQFRREVKRKRKAAIVHVGRGKKTKMYLQFMPFPMLLTLYPLKAKILVYRFLTENSVTLTARPERIFILPENKLKELSKVVTEANKVLEKANKVIKDIYESEVKPFLSEVLSKNHLKVNVEKIAPRTLHEILVAVTPIKISSQLIHEWMAKDPEVAQLMRQSLEHYVKMISEDIIAKLKTVVKNILEKKKITRKTLNKIEKLRETVKQLGLESVVAPILNDIQEALENPENFIVKYSDYETWTSSVKDRISTLF